MPFGWFGPWDAGRRFGWGMIVWFQYALLGATALVAVTLTVVQTQLDRSVFAPYLGSTSPVAAGARRRNTPALVATPLPPLNPR